MLFRACYEHEADAFHTDMAAGAAARRQEEQVRKPRTAKEEAPVALASGCMASQGDGPDLGRQKIKEIAFLDLKTNPNFFLASRRRSEGTLKRRFSHWYMGLQRFFGY